MGSGRSSPATRRSWAEPRGRERPHQVVKVANARYAGVSDLVLLCIDPVRLDAPLRYEIGDPGSDERFPHLYGDLELDAVVSVLDFPEAATGFELPLSPYFE
jgi:uncharacterized protein (DUF952 family)